MLQHGGAQIRLNSRLDAFEFGAHGNAVDAVSVGGERIDLAPGDAVVLAVPPEVAQPLVPELTAPDTFSAVVTAYFAAEAPAGNPLQTSVVNGVVDTVRTGGGQLAATIRDAGRWLDTPRDARAAHLGRRRARDRREPGNHPRVAARRRAARGLCGGAVAGNEASGRAYALDQSCAGGRLDYHRLARHDRGCDPLRPAGRGRAPDTVSERSHRNGYPVRRRRAGRRRYGRRACDRRAGRAERGWPLGL